MSAHVAGLATIAVAGGVVALASGGTAVAATAVNAPTIAVTYTPNEIGVTGSSTVTYTITNPNPSGSLYNVTFTDTLPSYATVDQPTNATTTGCGTPSVNAQSFGGSDGASGITVKAGTPCTLSISLVGNSPGDSSDTLTPLDYSASATGSTLQAPSGNETTATLDVLSAPTATITTPRKNAKYTYGEKVKAEYSCTAPSDANGTTLSACLGADDLGNTINPGQDLDTTVPGVHDLQVQSIDTDGDTTDAQISYTVLPDNVVKLKAAKAAKSGVVHLTLDVPGAGTVKVTEVHARTTLASQTLSVAAAKTLRTELKPTSAGKALLSTDHDKVSAKLEVTFTPKGGKKYTITKAVTLI